MLIRCPECDKEVSDVAKSCPHCGYPLHIAENVTEEPQKPDGVYYARPTGSLPKREQKKKGKGTWIVIGIIALFAGCGACMGGSDSSSDSVQTESAKESVEYVSDDKSENELVNSKGTVVSEPATMTEDVVTTSENKEIDVEVLAEYTLSDGIGWYTRHFMVVKNNSNVTVDISTSSLAYSANGTMVGADDASFDALGAGCVSVLYEAFEVEAEIDYYETELKVSPSEYYKSVIQDLSFVQNDIEGGAVFQVTNNGTDAAKFVEGYALFFQGEELVGYESTYFTDDDSEIKPGQTISKQLSSYKNFDRIEFYVTGRK